MFILRSLLFTVLTSLLQLAIAGTDGVSQRVERVSLSEQDYRSFLSAMGITEKRGWRESLVLEAERTLLLSQQAQLSDQQRRHINLTAEGKVDRWIIKEWQKRIAQSTALTALESKAIQAEVSGDLKRPERWLLWNIYLSFPEVRGGDAEVEIRSQMRAIREAIVGGEKFSEQAARHSQSASRYLDGRIGWSSLARLAPALRSTVAGMGKDHLSEIIESRQGLSLLYVEDVREASVLSRETQVKKLAGKRLGEKRKRTWQRLLDRAQAISEGELSNLLVEEKSDQLILRTATHTMNSGDLLHWGATVGQAARLQPPGDVRVVALEYLRVRQMAISAAEDGVESPPRMHQWLVHFFSAQTELDRRASTRVKEVGEREVAGHYRSHPEEFMEPRKWAVSLIQLDYRGEDQTSVKLLANQIMEGVVRGDLDFGNAAKRYSSGPGADQGGYLGERSAKELLFLDGITVKVLKRMLPGEIEGPIPGKRKMVLLKMHQIIAPTKKPLGEVREQITRWLETEAMGRAREEVLVELKTPTSAASDRGIRANLP